MGVSRSRRKGAAVLVLVLAAGSVVAAVLLVRHYGWGDASAVVTVAALPTVVVGIYLTVDGRFGSGPRGQAGPADLAGVADLMAVAVKAQWTAEAELRRLNDPYALPVRWMPADAGLFEDWPALVRLATSGGVGWPEPRPYRWAADLAGLAGTGSELVDVLDRVPTGRLVVLGEPGAGKTILLVRLVVGLLTRRAPGAPVPVLVPLASWNPRDQHLYEWLASRLVTDYPGLAEPAPDGHGGNRAKALLDTGLVLPILDGFDEIPVSMRGGAVAQVNRALRPGQRLVLASRTDCYEAAVNPPGGVEVRLTGAAGVELCPLDVSDIADYLRRSAGGPVGAARWAPVLAGFTANPPPVAQALTTPLMTSLARAVYNPRPDEPASAVARAPAEMLDPVLFPDRAAVERHLFDAFVPAAYRPHPDPARRGRWDAAKAERWLVFLARHLEYDRDGAPDLAWWQLRTSVSPHRPWVPPVAFGLVVDVLVTVVVVLVGSRVGGTGVGISFGFTSGLASGLGILFGWGTQTPARAMRWRARPGVVVGLVAGPWGGLGGGLGGGLAVGIVLGLVSAIAVGLGGGFEGEPVDLAAAADPASVLVQDRSAFLTIVLAAGLSGGLGLGLGFGLAGDLGFGPAVRVGLCLAFVGVAMFVIGLGLRLAFGLGLGARAGLGRTAWESFVLARAWLAMRGRLPRDLMAFLADAHQRGVLRQVGAVYQFRHIELQRRFASR